MKAAGTACHRHDSRSRIEASRRRAGGSAWRASRRWGCLTSLRQLVAHRGIALPGGWQRVESMRQWILPVVTTTAGRALWHRAAGRAAAHGEHEAAGTDCRYFGSGSYITASRRRAGGSAWIASRQSVLPVTALTAGRTSRHCAAGRAAARGKHRGSGYCLSPLRRWVAHPSRRPVRRQGVESMRQWVLPVVTTIGQRVVHRGIAPSGWLQRVEIEAVGTACHRYEPTTAGRTSRHRAAGHAAARGEHRGSGY